MAWWLRCLHCRLTARRSRVGFQHGPLLVQGAGPPQTFSVQVGYVSPGPFCVEFACSPCVHKGFPPLRTPTEKTCKITEHMSIPDQRRTVHFTWSPGATSCPLLLGGPGGGMFQDGEINSPRPQACACVCVSCAYVFVCL